MPVKDVIIYAAHAVRIDIDICPYFLSTMTTYNYKLMIKKEQSLVCALWFFHWSAIITRTPC